MFQFDCGIRLSLGEVDQTASRLRKRKQIGNQKFPQTNLHQKCTLKTREDPQELPLNVGRATGDYETNLGFSKIKKFLLNSTLKEFF